MNGEFLQGIAAKSASMVAAAAFAAIVWTSPLLAQDAGGDASSESAASGSTTAEPSSESGSEDSQASDSSSSGSDEEQAPEDVELRDRSEIAPGTRLHASIDVLVNWVDNFFYSPNNQQSAVGWFLNPIVNYGSASPRFRSNSAVGANIGFFSLGGTDDDYRDLFAQTGATWKVAPGHRLGYDILLHTGHDPFGLVRTEDGSTSRTLDRWVDEKYTLEYRLGQPRSSFSVENKASVYQKVYHTNRSVPGGGGTRFLDHDIESFETTGLYHYSPKTHFQLNLVTSHVNFARDFPSTPSRDAQEYRARAGVRWIATAKTTGDFRIGYLTRHFESNVLHSHNKLDWVVGVDWSPVKRTFVQLQTGRQSVESYNDASFIDVSYVRLAWKQEWLPRLTTQATTGYSYADFVGLQRHDETFFLNLRADYRLLPKLSVYGGYDLDDRTSNNGFFEYR